MDDFYVLGLLFILFGVLLTVMHIISRLLLDILYLQGLRRIDLTPSVRSEKNFQIFAAAEGALRSAGLLKLPAVYFRPTIPAEVFNSLKVPLKQFSLCYRWSWACLRVLL